MVLRSLTFALALAPADPSLDATTYLEQGRFAEAAAAIEATPPDTPEALERLRLAATIRVGLGQPALADADLTAIERAQPSRAAAAAAFWARRDLLFADLERREHATTYLRKHARFGGREREALAELTIATSLHEAACEPGLHAGLCTQGPRMQRHWHIPDSPRPRRWITWAEKYPPIRGRCATYGLGRIKVHPRLRQPEARARVHLERARRSLRRLASRPAPLSAELVSASLLAELTALDPALEAFLAETAPIHRIAPDRWLAGLTDSPMHRKTLRQQLAEIASTRGQLAGFIPPFDRQANTLRTRLTELAMRADSGALARLAWLRVAYVANHQAFAVLEWEPEGGFASRADAVAHCQRIHARTAPLVELVRDAYERCFADARATGQLDAVAEICEQRLSERWPADHAMAHEIFDLTPVTTSHPITIGVQLEAPAP